MKTTSAPPRSMPPPPPTLHLAGQPSDELARLAGLELPVARRVLAAVVGRDAPLETARELRRETQARLAALSRRERLEVVSRRRAADGFVKYLLRLPDGLAVEAVRIPLHDTHYTLCLSSQVGCALGCTFCATGEMGLVRSLESWEIVEQFLRLRAEADRPVRGVVFMGMGEPLHNYDAVLAAARTLCDPAGGALDAKKITISTAGLVPAIRRYTRERHRFRLAVSLTAATHEKRLQVMPVEHAYPLDELMDAVREHAASRRDRIMLEYVMISRFNVGEDDARALGALLSGLRVRFNPIPVHDASGRFQPPTPEEWRAFRDALARHLPGQPVVLRYSGGQDVEAGCGMLATRTLVRAAR